MTTTALHRPMRNLRVTTRHKPAVLVDTQASIDRRCPRWSDRSKVVPKLGGRRYKRRVVEERDFLTVAEVMAHLRMGRTFVYQEARRYLASSGAAGIPCRKFGRLLRFPTRELHVYAALRSSTPVPQRVEATPPARVTRPTRRRGEPHRSDLPVRGLTRMLIRLSPTDRSKNSDALARVVRCRLPRERGMRNGMSC